MLDKTCAVCCHLLGDLLQVLARTERQKVHVTCDDPRLHHIQRICLFTLHSALCSQDMAPSSLTVWGGAVTMTAKAMQQHADCVSPSTALDGSLSHLHGCQDMQQGSEQQAFLLWTAAGRERITPCQALDSAAGSGPTKPSVWRQDGLNHLAEQEVALLQHQLCHVLPQLIGSLHDRAELRRQQPDEHRQQPEFGMAAGRSATAPAQVVRSLPSFELMMPSSAMCSGRPTKGFAGHTRAQSPFMTSRAHKSPQAQARHVRQQSQELPQQAAPGILGDQAALPPASQIAVAPQRL